MTLKAKAMFVLTVLLALSALNNLLSIPAMTPAGAGGYVAGSLVFPL